MEIPRLLSWKTAAIFLTVSPPGRQPPLNRGRGFMNRQFRFEAPGASAGPKARPDNRTGKRIQAYAKMILEMYIGRFAALSGGMR
jgi:hypothetical protein